MPEKMVPSRFCDGFRYVETDVNYPAANFTFKKIPSGCVLEFPIEDDCHIFGFGLQLKQFDHRGRKLRLDVNADPVGADGESHAPVPFFVTNKGYGMYFDTARYAEFYCGKQKNTGKNTAKSSGGSAGSEAELYAVRQDTGLVMSVRIPVAAGVDVYVIEGDSITDIVSQYNRLAGGGPEVPEWSLGMLYRCYYQWDAEKIKSVADDFRERDIPCNIIGLEPGWHTHAYSCTYKWSDKYPNPDAFISYLRERNYHLSLWEHAFVHPEAEIHDALAPYSGDWLVWGGLVPDFATEEGRKTFADYHREKLVDHGIDGFKLDECDSSDFTGSWSFPLSAEFPSGLDGGAVSFAVRHAVCQNHAGRPGGAENPLGDPPDGRAGCAVSLCAVQRSVRPSGFHPRAGQRGLFRPALDAGIPSGGNQGRVHPPHPVPRLFLPVPDQFLELRRHSVGDFRLRRGSAGTDSPALSPDPDAEKSI